MKNKIKLGLIFIGSIGLIGCTERAENAPTDIASSKEAQIIELASLFSFDDEASLDNVHLKNANKSIVKTKGNTALKIDFHSKNNHESMLELSANDTWNWQSDKDVGLAFDISSELDSSTHLYVYVADSDGLSHNRSFVVPANSAGHYFIELKGKDLRTETGIRSNPNSWQSEYTPVIWRYGKKEIDLTKVKHIRFKVFGVPENKSLTFDNIRLISPKAKDENYLVGLVDKFGQSAKMNFVNKVESVEHLVSISDQEQASLSAHEIDARSKFNGWIDGPKLDASGYYRVEKYQGKWSLVDPEGYLFFSNGIANIRMANTSTITGYDFDASYIKQRVAGDLTPEDSVGLNRAPEGAWPTRKVTSSRRADMFTWLPKYDEPMGNHFGYRREVHTGVIEKGETYSFYQANLARKYQTDDATLIEKKWRETAVKRMQSWGFTSFGNWVDPSYYDMDAFPYFANGWIIGDFKTVSSGNDYWAPLPDPFDSKFSERALITVQQVANEVKNSPWCVGVFIDNEKSWGQMGQAATQYGVVIGALKLNANESPAKLHFTALLKAKYGEISQLNSAWQTDITSWEVFEAGVQLALFNEALEEDLSILLYEFAHKYFSVVDDAMKKEMPNHLYMGARFADWGMTPELRAAAADVVDVVSYNYYKETLNEDFWQFLSEIDRPSIIGEFHNGALDSGLLNPGLIHASSQTDRGEKYKDYVYSAIDNPYFVGTHWFQYIDSPLTGRALDGENYNVGFVSVTDIPYEPLVNAAKEVNQNIYTRRYGGQ